MSDSPGLGRRLGSGSERRRFAAISVLGQVGTGALFFVGSVMQARLLGPAGKGTFTAWTSIGEVARLAVAGPARVGFGRAYLDGRTQGLRRVSATHAAVVAGLALPVGVIASLLGADWRAVLAVVITTAVGGVVVDDLLMVNQAAKRAVRYQLPLIGQPLAFVLTIGVALLAGADFGLVEVYVAWAGSILAAAAAALVLSGGLPAGSRARVRDVLSFGTGSYATVVADWLIFRANRFAVLIAGGPVTLGLFSVVQNWAEAGWYAGTATGQALFEDQNQLSNRSAKRALAKAGIVVAAFAAALAASGVFLIEPIFGDEFSGLGAAVALLAPGIVSRAIGFGINQIGLARGMGGSLLVPNLITLFVAVPLWLVGTDVLGVEGASISTSVVFAIQACLTWRVVFT